MEQCFYFYSIAKKQFIDQSMIIDPEKCFCSMLLFFIAIPFILIHMCVCKAVDEHRHSNKAHVNKQAQRPLSKEIQRINTDLCIFHKRIFSLFTLGLLLLTHFIALKVQSACNCLLKSVSDDSFQCVNKVMRY